MKKAEAELILKAAHDLCQATAARHGPNAPYGTAELDRLMSFRESLEDAYAPKDEEPETVEESEETEGTEGGGE